MGLSPRVRGNLFQAPQFRPSMGSIPACAGEPPIDNRTRDVPPVYPRVCGGTTLTDSLIPSMCGLSPRVRGNPNTNDRTAGGYGSIPACAGEPIPSTPVPAINGVYPRVCGGTYSKHPSSGHQWGLSPRVRGNLLDRRRFRASFRSIPACAGEPKYSLDPTQPHKVYPRVCGGTVRTAPVPVVGWGLSPRVRGNLHGSKCLATHGRSIPACAGEPTPHQHQSQVSEVYPRVCGGTTIIVPRPPHE